MGSNTYILLGVGEKAARGFHTYPGNRRRSDLSPDAAAMCRMCPHKLCDWSSSPLGLEWV